MGKSIKKTPCGGHTKKESEKQWKRFQNRRLRRLVRVMLQRGENVNLNLRDISNISNAPKDGKAYYKTTQKEWLRK